MTMHKLHGLVSKISLKGFNEELLLYDLSYKIRSWKYT